MEPEPGDIAIVLSRASKLHSKLSSCIIERASSAQEEEEEDYEDTETLSLINIRDALESLEHQLSSLQDEGGKDNPLKAMTRTVEDKNKVCPGQ
ncbi:uncharacterized protein LOC131047683 [Cryptomeria japonica]|uniref:uncharacterized protein LOC131047683 n=1 Tax=Cryptomeria japonica TaxID=3369 RepID=UPI0027DA19EB|nr:uncharacterized protein LOC131047683 [Cryptomeria japonica]